MILKKLISKIMLLLCLLFAVTGIALLVYWGFASALDPVALLAAIGASGLFLALYRIIDLLEGKG